MSSQIHFYEAPQPALASSGSTPDVAAARRMAYRRLAAAILQLDVRSMASSLQAQRSPLAAEAASFYPGPMAGYQTAQEVLR